MNQGQRDSRVLIDLGQVKTAHQLHELLASQLSFPDFYGHNWDAFWDAITALVEMPGTLVLTNWQTLTARLPRDAAIMKKCLDRMAEQYPTLAATVVFA